MDVAGPLTVKKAFEAQLRAEAEKADCDFDLSEDYDTQALIGVVHDRRLSRIKWFKVLAAHRSFGVVVRQIRFQFHQCMKAIQFERRTGYERVAEDRPNSPYFGQIVHRNIRTGAIQQARPI